MFIDSAAWHLTREQRRRAALLSRSKLLRSSGCYKHFAPDGAKNLRAQIISSGVVRTPLACSMPGGMRTKLDHIVACL
jgi:hypothetical protein